MLMTGIPNKDSTGGFQPLSDQRTNMKQLHQPRAQ